MSVVCVKKENYILIGFVLVRGDLKKAKFKIKPRFDGFRGYEKMGFGYGSHTHIQNTDPVFFGYYYRACYRRTQGFFDDTIQAI